MNPTRVPIAVTPLWRWLTVDSLMILLFRQCTKKMELEASAGAIAIGRGSQVGVDTRIYKKPRPFRHLFVADRILRAWYRGIKNAGSRKRAQGRAQDIPYHSPYYIYIYIIYKYHVSNWLFVSYPSFLPCTMVTFEIGWSICLQEVSCLFTSDVTCRMENCSFGCVDWS